MRSEWVSAKLAIVLGMSLALPTWCNAASGGTFTRIGDMMIARVSHGLAVLPDGRVLIAGGNSNFQTTSSVEIYDPTAKTFTLTGSMLGAREFCTFNNPVPLANGKVLVTGGRDYPTILASAELYDESSGTFSQTGSMSVPRWCPTVTLLADGRVLVAGGSDQSGTYENSAEIYDPASGTFSATAGNMTSPRGFAMATLLSNGKVFIMGGVNSIGELNTAELFDPASGTFSPAGSTPSPVAAYGMALLTSGKVLVTGFKNLPPVQLYDPATGTFTEGGSEHGLMNNTMDVALRNGNALNVGPTAHVYVSAAAQFIDGPKLLGSLSGAVLLKDGTVLVCGGAGGPNLYIRGAGIYAAK